MQLLRCYSGLALRHKGRMSFFWESWACADFLLHSCAISRRGLLAQAQSIEQGTSDATGRALLHRHLTFHYMVDADMLAVLTCVAEWEAGFVEDVLPCFKYSGAPLPLAVRRRRLRAARSQV